MAKLGGDVSVHIPVHGPVHGPVHSPVHGPVQSPESSCYSDPFHPRYSFPMRLSFSMDEKEAEARPVMGTIFLVYFSLLINYLWYNYNHI